MASPWLSHNRITWGLVSLGLAMRVWHYLVNHTIWYDEAVLLANILNKSYAGLLGPLNHAVAAPPIFLWGLKLLSEVCGDEPYCWRFVPFACSCGTLLLTVPLVRKILSPSVGVIAVGLVAASANHIWLGYSIKPYAGDALLTTALLYFYLATEAWTATKRLAVLALMIPPILCTSYPAAFVIGGLLLALLPSALGERANGLAMWAVASLSALVTFACLYFGPIKNQRVEGLLTEWDPYFLNYRQPDAMPWWIIEHTSTIFQFCYNPVGFYLFAVAPFGLVSIWRQGRRDLVLLLVTPFLLAMVASAMQAYPYGFNRLMFFIAPCALLLGGIGMDFAFRNLPWKPLHILTGSLLIVGGFVIPAHHLFIPSDRPDSSSTAAYIRANRIAGDRVASDEQTYAYFFRGELLSLDEAANSPPGTRIWVPMDHYDPVERRAYVTGKLRAEKFDLVAEILFRDSGTFLLVRRE